MNGDIDVFKGNIIPFAVHENIIDALWIKFSEIQYATYLMKDSETVERFKAWLKSGDDEDAWS